MKTSLTMTKLNVMLSLLSIAAVAGFFLSAETNVSAQDRGYTVWVKTSPCSGRHDWVSVAKENPAHGGGSASWSTADLVLTGGRLRCVRVNNICTLADANAEVAMVRASSQFSNYCCRDYSVWEHSQTRERTVVLGKSATAGVNWEFVKGNLCCEEAETLAGKPGVCSGDKHGGQTGYIGCFKDPNSPFDLDGFLERSSSNTPQRCIATCRAKGFAYAGVQYGESCLCGNSYGKFGEATNCNMKCTGDSTQICGGSNANSVYGTGTGASGGIRPRTPGAINDDPKINDDEISDEGGENEQPGRPDRGGIASINGRWNSSIGYVYEITQSGSSFSWRRANDTYNETASGQILNGNKVRAKWTNSNGSDSAEGQVTNVDANGRATRIQWTNGVSFTRN